MIFLNQKNLSLHEKFLIRDWTIIQLEHPPLSVKHNYGKDHIRYLGVWLEYNSNHIKEKTAIRIEVKKLTNKMKYKSITTRHIRYIINHVVIPRIIYRSTHLILMDVFCNLIILPLYTIKHLARLCKPQKIIYCSILVFLIFNTYLILGWMYLLTIFCSYSIIGLLSLM